MAAPVTSTVRSFKAAGMGLGRETSQDAGPEVLTSSSHGASGEQQPAVRLSCHAERKIGPSDPEPARAAGRTFQAAGVRLGRETSHDAGPEVLTSSSHGASDEQQPLVRLGCHAERRMFRPTRAPPETDCADEDDVIVVEERSAPPRCRPAAPTRLPSGTASLARVPSARLQPSAPRRRFIGPAGREQRSDAPGATWATHLTRHPLEVSPSSPTRRRLPPEVHPRALVVPRALAGVVPTRAVVIAPPTGAPSGITESAMRALSAGHRRRADVRLPARPALGFASDRERSAAWAEAAADALLGAMAASGHDPMAALLGGELATRQVSKRDCKLLARVALLDRSGSDGQPLIDVIKMIAFIEGFSAERRKADPGFDPFPMSPALAGMIVRGEHLRGVAAGTGARGGQMVGANVLRVLKYMRLVGYDIRGLDEPVVRGAAPSAKAAGGKRTTAATLGPLTICHLEWWAATDVAVLVAYLNTYGLEKGWKCARYEAGVAILRFVIRSFVLCLYTSARIQDAVRVVFSPDPVDLGTKIYGQIWRTKDGEAMDLHGVAAGMLGPFAWLGEYLTHAAFFGQAFPAWDGPRGSKADLTRATVLTEVAPERRKPGDPLAGVASKPMMRLALVCALRVPPLARTEPELKSFKERGHSMHGTPSDAARMAGEFPPVPWVQGTALERGFSKPERRMLGHWLRAQHEASERPDEARGAGPAAPPGARAARDDMDDRYTRGEGRGGERCEQLRVRGRLVDFLRMALHQYGVRTGRSWRDLPRDPAGGWRAIFPFMEG